MKLTLNFGLNGAKKQIDWYRDLMDFPKLIRFQNAKWEWAIYSNVGKDYELTFSQIPTYDPSFYVDMPSFEDMFEWGATDRCQCGAVYSSFSWDHMRFCPKWTKW